MKANFIIIMLAALTFIGVESCKKNDTGGEVTLAALPKHHGTPIYGATLYVKFDATELPTDIITNYDIKIVGEPNESHVHVEGLRYGEYFLYMEGYDSTISAPVSGGTGVSIKWKEREEDIDVEVPVTE